MNFSARSNHGNTWKLVLASAVILALGIIRPQAALSQRGRRVGGGVYPGGGQRGATLPVKPPTQSPPRLGGGNTAPRSPIAGDQGPGGRRGQAGGNKAPRSPIVRTPPTRSVPGTGTLLPPSNPGAGYHLTPGSPYYPYQYNAAPTPLPGTGWSYYFPGGSAYYPNYYPYAGNGTVPSPFAYYNGVFPPYIGSPYVAIVPPPVAYVPIPYYNTDGLYQNNSGNTASVYVLNPGWNDATMEGTDSQTSNAALENLAAQNPWLADAIRDITAAWNRHDIAALARHVRQDAPVAVFLGGRFDYSLPGGDYLNTTRDALTAINTVEFAIDTVEQKTPDVYLLTGHHVYADQHKGGARHRVLVSYVLQKAEDRYTIVQVGTARARIPAKNAAAAQTRQLVAPRLGAHAFVYNPAAPQYPLTMDGLDRYFPTHQSYYGHYYPAPSGNATTYSVYYYFSGIVPPFIAANDVVKSTPPTAYVPLAHYGPDGLIIADADVNNASSQKGTISVADAAAQDALLGRAITDIATAWQQQDVRSLARHIHRDNRLAAYMKGKFFYTLDGGDYLSLTRDLFAGIKGGTFTLDGVQPQATGIYTVNGRYTYTDSVGKSHTILLNYVLAKLDDDYYATQFNTAPEKREP